LICFCNFLPWYLRPCEAQPAEPGEAEPLFWQLLKQRETKFGPNHPQTFRHRGMVLDSFMAMRLKFFVKWDGKRGSLEFS